ncbi:MAG: hypothetical protein DRR08_12575 [Candidatus Parabeggiatoa sp. nov. 2]|nr:MAG: hypothetical protein B6247_20675 [Beggiatoa sp. 4572_84]RKZ59959.1 MAG: hypothetical protein DRR08_12575 [Gammaproteobacteria bacterium]
MKNIFVPPLYSCQNPHIADIITPLKPVKPVSSPYSEMICAGKNTYVYDAHTYHTKVPPEGIAKLIEYYTNQGDVVLDPFCGSGMTGVACSDRGRGAILCDISPAATFIAYNMTTPIDGKIYWAAIQEILESAHTLEQTLYTTQCRTCFRETPMLYMVWSYGMLCQSCHQEFILWDVARDEKKSVRDSKIKSEFNCPHCDAKLKKRDLKRTCRYPVAVGYRCCESGLKEQVVPPNEYDLKKLAWLEQTNIPKQLWYPTDQFRMGVNTKQPIAAGMTSVDKVYTTRALWAMSFLWDRADKWPDPKMRLKLLFTLTSLYKRVTVFSEFRFWGGSGNTANLNVPAIMNEQNVFKTFERKAKTIKLYFDHAPKVKREVRISTQSACHLEQLPDKSIDYVFTDPPFGSNINYSEMNFLWESWLGVHTDIVEEAIINKTQGKQTRDYKILLEKAFSEMKRVLKDKGWLTVVFHNSSARVWQTLQAAITDAGFYIQGIQTFDKQHGTFKQFVSDNAVGYDLVLHCQKTAHQVCLKQEQKQIVCQQVAQFIREALRDLKDYRVQYLHVSRQDELDYRKLYAQWLTQTISKTVIELDFNEFREIVDQVKNEFAQKSKL